MALINCPECDKQISDAAEACPNCAYPIGGRYSKSLKGVRTVEATGKSWKSLQMLSVISLVIGIILMFGADQTASEPSVLPALFMIFGVFGYIAGRFGAWWHHG